MRYFAFVLLFTFYGCVNDEVLLHPPNGRSFWTLKIGNTLETKKVVATYFGESRYAISYVEVGNKLAPGVIRYVMREFDEKIAPRLNNLFTEPLDVDGNGKIVFLFLDIEDGYNGTGYIAGYFDALNQFSDSTVKKLTGRRSNEMELIYLDTYPSDVGGLEFLATLAHEYQHLLQFSHNYRLDTDEAEWVDEGLSEISSDLAGYGPQLSRLIGFRSIGNGNCNFQGCYIGDSLITWDGNLADYSHVYVYFRYLTDVFGESLLAKIFRNEKQDLEGVEEAFSQHGIGLDCGGFDSGYFALFPRFICSYRYFWGAILETSVLQGSSGNHNLSPAPVPGFFASGHNPRLALFPGDSGSILQNVVPNNIQSLYPFTFSYYSHNGINQTPKLSDLSCQSCETKKFSLIYNNSHFVVFNHHFAENPAKTRIVDLQIIEGVERITQELDVFLKARPSSQIGYKIHFHQYIPFALKEKLLQGE